MTDVRKAWDEAGEALSGLGLRLKLHYEQQRGDDDAEAAVESAVAKLGVALQDAFDALGAAASDEAVRSDVLQVGQRLTDALSVTFAEVSDPVRKAFDRKD
jgi:Flp pilus assembly pilin Flp